LSVRDSVAVLSLASGTLRSLIAGDQAAYLTTGHIVFSAGEGRVRVVPFDLGKLAVTGAAVPVFEVFRGPGSGGNYFAVSSSGTLVYVPGGFDRSLALVDRNGREVSVPAAHRGFRFPRISPDGRRAVVTIDPRPSKIWVVDLQSGALAPVAAPGRPDTEHRIHAVWSPDGRQVMYGRGTMIDIANVDGEPNVRLALRNPANVSLAPSDWLPDGRLIGHLYGSPPFDIVAFRAGDSVVSPLVSSDAIEVQGVVSPDGRWLAYSSNASGAREVYVRPLVGPGDPIAVSTSGGVEPRWSRDGTELYYRNGQAIMAVSVRTRPPFSAKPQQLFSGGYDFLQDDNWDVGPDGLFLMVKSDPNAGTQFVVVFNWFDELRTSRSASK
jgi:serine/threonine-protein kinase